MNVEAIRAGFTPPIASHYWVDIWLMELDEYVNAPELWLLSDEERRHAARLRVGAEVWAGARAALRHVLGRYLCMPPAAVRLRVGPGGKPLIDPGAAIDLRFSLSHSSGMAAIAVRLGAEVGVDVEKCREGVDTRAVAREHGIVLGSEGDFFQAWTCHEALAKASGCGITAPMAAHSARFAVRVLKCVPGTAAAVASEGEAWDVRVLTGG